MCLSLHPPPRLQAVGVGDMPLFQQFPGIHDVEQVGQCPHRGDRIQAAMSPSFPTRSRNDASYQFNGQQGEPSAALPGIPTQWIARMVRIHALGTLDAKGTILIRIRSQSC